MRSQPESTVRCIPRCKGIRIARDRLSSGPTRAVESRKGSRMQVLLQKMELGVAPANKPATANTRFAPHGCRRFTVRHCHDLCYCRTVRIRTRGHGTDDIHDGVLRCCCHVIPAAACSAIPRGGSSRVEKELAAVEGIALKDSDSDQLFAWLQNKVGICCSPRRRTTCDRSAITVFEVDLIDQQARCEFACT